MPVNDKKTRPGYFTHVTFRAIEREKLREISNEIRTKEIKRGSDNMFGKRRKVSPLNYRLINKSFSVYKQISDFLFHSINHIFQQFISVIFFQTFSNVIHTLRSTMSKNPYFGWLLVLNLFADYSGQRLQVRGERAHNYLIRTISFLRIGLNLAKTLSTNNMDLIFQK